jgi:hypothetical protein
MHAQHHTSTWASLLAAFDAENRLFVCDLMHRMHRLIAEIDWFAYKLGGIKAHTIGPRRKKFSPPSSGLRLI